jgi:hypothetical protein
MHKKILNLFPKHIELVYVDYRDTLDGSEDKIQSAIQKQEWSELDDCILDDWLWESQDNSIDCLLKELNSDIQREFNVDEDRADEFIENHREELQEYLQEHDESTVMNDLLKNTSDLVMFYDTGEYIEECLDEEELNKTIKFVKKILKIKSTELQYDHKLSVMIEQASYGGRLVVYFNGDINRLMNLQNKNVITFENANIAIIDTMNGSGYNCQLDGYKFSLSFSPENIFLDKTIKYNYTYAVCSMSSSWCDDTNYSFSTKKIKATNKISTLNAELNNELELNKKFKAGKCTFGDMDMNRHKNTVYINDFPCGTHCKDCGTFWID